MLASAPTRRLPPDAVLLPLADGALLVSRQHAVFCRIPAAELAAVRRALAKPVALAALSPALLAELDRHACFGPPRPAPRMAPTVQLQLTNACNLACAYCCTDSGAARAREVTLPQMLEVVKSIPAAVGPGASVALLGGEPLLVPWAPDLAEAILAEHLPVTIFSNGLPLAEERLARRVAGLMARGVKVRISLAGPCAASCDVLSGAARFEAALTGVAQLARWGGKPVLDLMLIPAHLDAIAAELPGLRRRLPPGTTISLGVLFHAGREGGAHLFASRRELDAALDRVAFEAGERIAAVAPRPVMERREGCSCAMGHHLHVRSDGVLFNCFKMEEQVGDLAAEGFTATARAVRNHPHRAVALPVCRECPLATLCGGGCRSEVLLYSGDADRPPCGPWRVRALAELLARDRVDAVEWPLAYLIAEARDLGLDVPADLRPRQPSRHLKEDEPPARKLGIAAPASDGL